jgi:hypothetical protein
MEEFSRWTANKEANLKHFLTPHTKFEAFTVGTQQRNTTLTRLVFSTYHLIDDKELFVEPIRNLVSRKQYKEVSPENILWHLFMCLSFNFSCCVALVVPVFGVVWRKVALL